MRDSSLQRRGRRYSFQTHGQSEQGTLPGNFLLKREAAGDVNIWRPSFNGGPTTIRIFPARNPENPAEWDGYRFSSEQQDFGDWIRRYPAVRSMGNPPVTFIMYDPADQSLDPQMMPAWVLYRAIDRAVAQGVGAPHWAPLLRGGQGTGAQLSRPKEVYLVQCAMMQYKGKILNPPRGGASNDGTILMELGPSAGRALLEAFDQPVANYQGDPSDLTAMFQAGDPVSVLPNTGKYVTFFNLKQDPRVAQQAAQAGQAQAASAFGQQAQTSQTGGQQISDIGFGCYIEATFQGISADMSHPQMQALVASKVKSWDEILHFPTVLEQAALLADKFPADVIAYAWQDHPDWIPDHIRQAASGGDGGTVPASQGAVPHSQMPPLPPEPQSGDAPAPGGWGAPAPGADAAQSQQPPAQQSLPPHSGAPAQPQVPPQFQQADQPPAEQPPAQATPPQGAPPAPTWPNTPNTAAPAQAPAAQTPPVPDPSLPQADLPVPPQGAPATPVAPGQPPVPTEGLDLPTAPPADSPAQPAAPPATPATPQAAAPASAQPPEQPATQPPAQQPPAAPAAGQPGRAGRGLAALAASRSAAAAGQQDPPAPPAPPAQG